METFHRTVQKKNVHRFSASRNYIVWIYQYKVSKHGEKEKKRNGHRNMVALPCLIAGKRKSVCVNMSSSCLKLHLKLCATRSPCVRNYARKQIKFKSCATSDVLCVCAFFLLSRTSVYMLFAPDSSSEFRSRLLRMNINWLRSNRTFALHYFSLKDVINGAGFHHGSHECFLGYNYGLSFKVSIWACRYSLSLLSAHVNIKYVVNVISSVSKANEKKNTHDSLHESKTLSKK